MDEKEEALLRKRFEELEYDDNEGVQAEDPSSCTPPEELTTVTGILFINSKIFLSRTYDITSDL